MIGLQVGEKDLTAIGLQVGEKDLTVIGLQVGEKDLTAIGSQVGEKDLTVIGSQVGEKDLTLIRLQVREKDGVSKRSPAHTAGSDTIFIQICMDAPPAVPGVSKNSEKCSTFEIDLCFC